MRETILGQVVNAAGPLKSPRNLQDLAEKEATENGKLGPYHTKPHQALFREIVRTVTHPVFLRNEARDPFGGLERFHELQDKGMGGVVVEMHFSQIDPMWAIDVVTKKRGGRNIKAVQPIAADRAIPGLVALSKATGVEMVKVVTPDVKERADKKDPNNTVKLGDGMDEYLNKAVDVAGKGGIAFVPPKATREDHLEQSGRDQAVTSKLLLKLYMAGVRNIAIHFVAFDMDGIKNPDDFHTRRKYNIGRKHTAIHGNTYTLEEFITLAIVPGTEDERPRTRDIKALTNSEKLVFEELSKIAPKTYRRSEAIPTPANEQSPSNEGKVVPALKLSNESIAATLARTFEEFDADFIQQLVDETAAKNKLSIPVTPLVERRLRDIRRERDGKSV